MSSEKPLLLGCGILKNEVTYLCKKNKWDIDFKFLDSALHCNLKKLGFSLREALDANRNRQIIVTYGTCHPLMDKILSNFDASRINGQNCIEMLLGREYFMTELIKGAFFLLEEWANRWETIIYKTYSTYKLEIRREIFKLDRSYFLAVRTPCSGDFSTQAEHVASQMQVPLKWTDISLDRFEAELKRKIEGN